MNKFFVALLILCSCSIGLAQSPPRYQALLQNGQRVQGKTLTDWHEAQRTPRLDNQSLLEAGNPARWLRDRTQPLSEAPPACVEMHTGDCLPGMVSEARSGQESKFDPQPPHLIVEPRCTLEPPRERPVSQLRVDTSYVRRIVWQRRRKLEYQPGTLFYRDGRIQQFQAFRLEGAVVQVLLADGAQRVPFSEISELHLPAIAQPWNLHFSELATLCTKPETRLWQLETGSGLIVTSSPERFAPRFEGNPNESIRWVHALQPAWSLDLLWIPIREVTAWRFFAQNEVPLQRALDLHRGAKQLAGVRWLSNRNILGGPLRSLTTDFGFGVGIQAPAQLALPLTTDCLAVRFNACLDRLAGRGGCAKVRLRLPGGNVLWESPLLQGSEVVADTGRIALPPATTQLTFEFDQLHEGRPPGADPFDIRDHVNLADGYLELEPAAVARELERRVPERFAAWKGWQVSPARNLSPAPNRELNLSQERVVNDKTEKGFLTAISMKDRPLSLARELALKPGDNWLVIAAARVRPQGAPVKLEVRIAGQPAAEFEIPELRGEWNETPPLVVPLAPYQQAKPQTLAVEIRQLAAPPDAAPVRWRSIALASQHPTSFDLYEDNPKLTAESTNSSSAAEYVTADRFSGRGCMQLTGNGVYRVGLKTSLQIRERPQWGEYRFVRFAVRRPQKQKSKGRFSLEFEAAAAGRRPYRFDTGKGKPAFDSAVRLWDGDLPEHWIVVTRDLFADFGEFEIRDMLVSCFDGDSVYMDHAYLGRSPSDLDRLPPRPSSWEDATKTLDNWPKDITKRMTPALVGVEFAGGRWCGGVAIRPEGEILVPGHLLGSVNEDVTVHLHDGKTFAAKTKGICRDRDLGMVKAEKAQQLVVVPFWDVKEAKLADDYVAMIMPPKPSGGFKIEAVQVEVRQAVRGRLWSTLETPEWIPGGVLFHRHGYLMGLHVGRHPRGGFIFERPIQGDQLDPTNRLRGGDVFGSWPLGTEPLIGFTVKRRSGSTEPGVAIETIDSPAVAAAGLKPGEVVLTCDGRALFAPSDLSQCLEQKDAGQEVTLEVERAGGKESVKVKLERRP
ncbi:PDZ domain-containing protein [Anatilimnocola floriformis]|uniref:PDZ domain-containing protein n=1 Tax=Anatilimnocola floriformis TaxID=2948575 RepID=UPI0020C22811|nr:PDZ domain-containing protein [Anatilimnocola floriformis]